MATTGSGGGEMRLDAMAATAGTRVLVVDDEPYITELLATTLRLAGYDVLTAGSGSEAVRAAAAGNPELLILDIMLPDTDGFELCRRLRLDRPRLPVVFLTARDSTEDKVRGLTLGGDDYVTKPFSVAEVLARVQAVLRRTQGGAEESAALRCGDLELDEQAHEVRRAGRQLELSPTEYKLLRYLLVNTGRVVSKAQILDHVWQYDFGGDAAVVEKFISRLRHKVDAEGPPLIHTVRGFGYSLRPAKG